MICLICRQSETSSGLVSILLHRGEMNLTVNRVHANVCTACGEGFLEEAVAMNLLRYAEAVFLTGSLESEYGYDELISLFQMKDY